MKRLLLMFLTWSFVTSLSYSVETIKIGVIYDNESYIEKNSEILEEELEKNFEGTDFKGVIQENLVIKNKSEFSKELERLEKSTNIDAIMTFGVVASELTLERENGYSKPVVATFGIGGEVPQIKNLAYIAEDLRIAEDIELANQLKEIKKVTFLNLDIYRGDSLKNKVMEIEKDLREKGYEVNGIFTDENIEDIEEKLEGTDLLYMFEVDYENVDEILELACKNKIMTFARVTTDIENEEVLLGYDNSSEVKRRIRASVVNVIRRLEGDSPSEIVTNLGKTEKNLQYNMKVGKKIGVFPGIVFSQKVDFIGRDEKEKKELKFIEGLDLTLSNNVGLLSKKRELEVEEYKIKSSKSQKKPNIGAYIEYDRLDEDTASAAITSAENNLYGGISLNYLIYDDEVDESIELAEYNEEIVKAKYEEEKLDVIQSYAIAYLSILEQNSNMEIEKYNYKLLKEFLGVARTKFEVGSAGPEDIYRFESEIANSLSNIAEVEGQIRVVEANLSNILNEKMGTSYDLKDIEAEGIDIFEVKEASRENNLSFENMADYLVKVGIEKSPEIKQIEKQIEAKERELKSVKRRRYTPKVSAFGAITDDLVDDWGEGSDLTSGGSAWSVGAKMEISLYEGGNIGYETSRIEKEIESLILSKKDLENEISEGISASYSNVLKDYIRVATTKEGAIAANKNLELISDFYAKGTISISDLLDARTNSISADQIEIAAKYGYFKSLINLERSKGSYYLLSKPEDKKEEIEKLKVYIEENLGGE